ncbi:MAG: methyltransferase [Peptococcaceae bacterium]|nr:methyltransferase [Peptococcaceae bacterium]
MLIRHPASAVEWARAFIFPILGNSVRVVDATAGNGYDTLFLVQNISVDGKVYAFDIQESALLKTRNRISDAGLIEKIIIIPEGHEHILKHISQEIDGAMFNLGYLPGSDKKLVTVPQSTVEAVEGALKLLKTGGRISIVAYTGHPGAEAEDKAVSTLLEGLNIKEFNVQRLEFHNSVAASPKLYFIIKMC